MKNLKKENVINIENNSSSYFPILTTTITITLNNKNILFEMQFLCPCDIVKDIRFL
jgi:hypothetical protein